MHDETMTALVRSVAYRTVELSDIPPDRRRLLDEVLRPYGPERLASMACLGMDGPVPDGELELVLAASRIRSEAYAAERLERERRTRSFVLREPTVLFRSVSVEGLHDLIDSGVVRGRLNRWHRNDIRRVVLFGDAFGRVVSQGEDVHRAVAVGMSGHPLVVAERQARAALDGMGDVRGTASRADAHAHLMKAAARLRATERILMEEEEARRVASPASSVVLRTHPLVGARVWPDGHRRNRMGRMAEYGFPDGAVGVGDVEAVMLVKDRNVVAEVAPGDALGTLEELAAYRCGPSPR